MSNMNQARTFLGLSKLSVATVDWLKYKMNPPQLIVLVFFGLIWIGAFLLMLPISTVNGTSIGLIDAYLQLPPRYV
ncbi:hypothetical protein FHS16_006064 [Paenibacillus endophyticus]|uniref:Uncharacterized protein n=1 Tax=Paenibacillus endophyticus TaxID=1294268 RepID=A0A7W5GDY8_9BACL|nr:hypothetical protein [Paenibacillus endophyticus]MBB3155948.1 hypothetical protein [Paenibacillus endophyticus]